MPPKQRRPLKRPATMPTTSSDGPSPRRSPRRSTIHATTATRNDSTSLLAQKEDDATPAPLRNVEVSTSSSATVQEPDANQHFRANFVMPESFAEIARGALHSLAYTSKLQGGNVSFSISNDNIEVARELRKLAGDGALRIGVTALGVLLGCRLLRPLIEDAVNEVFGRNRDDQEVQIKTGSLHVLLHCFTDERFLEVLNDYESGGIKERLQKEFSQVGIEVQGLTIEIENMEEVEKIKAAINKRSSSPTKVMEEAIERKISPRIIVQGGVDRLKSTQLTEIKEEYMNATKESAKKGYAILMKGGTAVDAVEEAVRVLEDDDNFNAGRGSNLNCNGEVECDAMIMEGHTLKNGAVISGRHFFNPVLLSKKIMYETPHCALSGDGALEFAREKKFPICDPKKLISPYVLKISQENFANYLEGYYGGESEKEHQKQADTNDIVSAVAMEQDISDTVSAVAMDANGHLACATSSGGVAAKLKGRVSDASLVGCGGYANKMGGATVTGVGESIIKMTLAREVVYSMENGKNAQDSAKNALEKLKELYNDPDLKTLVNGREVTTLANGGVIAIDKNGNFGKGFTTPVMFWASIKDNTLEFGFEPNKVDTDQL